MRLLLDEMISAVVAEQLRQRGHDVVAVQDPDRAHQRGIDDCVLLSHADDERRAVVTDNVPDFYRCHLRAIQDGRSHHGLLLFANQSLPRHRQDVFVSHMIAALERALRASPDEDGSGWIRWLSSHHPTAATTREVTSDDPWSQGGRHRDH